MSIPLSDLEIAMAITGYASLMMALDEQNEEKIIAYILQAKAYLREHITPDVYKAAYELVEKNCVVLKY